MAIALRNVRLWLLADIANLSMRTRRAKQQKSLSGLQALPIIQALGLVPAK
jgi:hypothetical protein